MKATPSLILVPSKGRPNGSTFQTLRESRLKFAIIVEPQDRLSYRLCNDGTELIVLPENNRGIEFVRQFGREYAEQSKTEFYWMLDDDITQFFITDATAKKNVKITAISALLMAEERLDRRRRREKVGIVALEYQQLAWNAKAGQEAINSYADVAILARTGTGISYRNIAPKEDRDFALQHIAAGWETVRYRDISFSVPQNGSNKGGLFDLYQKKGNEEKASKQLAKMWPGVVTFHRKRDGRPDAKVNWKAVRSQHETIRT